MMYYLNNGEIVQRIEDLENVLDESTYKAVEGLSNECISEATEDLEYYKYEKEHYELRFEDAKSQLYDAQKLVEDLEEYLIDSKRINRNKILEYVKDLSKLIENGIDA